MHGFGDVECRLIPLGYNYRKRGRTLWEITRGESGAHYRV